MKIKEETEVLLENVASLCEEYRLKNFHCSESSIRAISDVLGIPLSDDLLRVSSGFRGGGGGFGDRCGVVESGIMLISFIYGRSNSEVDVSDYSYLIRELHQRFNDEMGSFHCRILKPFAYKLSGDKKNCGYVYQNGSKIVARLLLEAEELIANIPLEEKYGYQNGNSKTPV